MKPFEAVDLFEFDGLFTQEELDIRNSVREFVGKSVLPVIAEHYEKGTFPDNLIPEIASLGLLGAHLEGYGCAGVNGTAYGLIMQELERGDSGVRSFVSVQGSLCMYPIWRYGSEELKQKYLPKMASGEIIGCFGLTEPDHGSNPGGMVTRAKKDGNDYILNGAKMWITNGSVAKVAIVWAKDETDQIIGFAVDTNTKGFKAIDIKHKFSLCASRTSELVLEDCRVPASQKLNVIGIKGPLSCLSQARYGIAWGAIGAAQACFDEVRNYTLTRTQFDKPLASFQLIQAKLANMATEITKMQALTLQLGRLKDQENVRPYQISMAKMNNVSAALQIARTCRDMLGANGITFEYQTGRHMLNLESVNTYEGTEDIHRLILGEKITGIAAYKG